MENTILEKLVSEDFGIEYNGKDWARSVIHNSLVINLAKGIFYWNSQDISGDALVYLTKVRKLNIQDAKEYLKHSGFTGTFISEISAGTEVITYPKLVDIFHESIWENDRHYFYNRGITDDTIRRFRLGYYNNFYTIPFYMDGTFKQIQLRRDSPKLITNYYKGVGPVLFNSDILRLTNKIYFTEGIIGAIILAQLGIPAVSMNIGSEGFMPEWVKYFVRQKEIYLLFDRDSAGDFGAIRTATILGEYRCKIYNFWGAEGKGYAVDDFLLDNANNVDELMDLVENESKYSFEVRPTFLNKKKLLFT